MKSPSILVRMNRIFLVLSQKMSHVVPSSSRTNWHLPGMLGVLSTTQSVWSVSTFPAKVIAGRVKQSTSSSIFMSSLPSTFECVLVFKIAQKSVIYFAPHGDRELLRHQYLATIWIRAIAYLFHLSTS